MLFVWSNSRTFLYFSIHQKLKTARVIVHLENNAISMPPSAFDASSNHNIYHMQMCMLLIGAFGKSCIACIQRKLKEIAAHFPRY